MPRVPLPDSLGDAFTVAEGTLAGLGEGRMYGPDLSRPTHGVRATREPSTLRDLAAATALALPDDSAFSHRTAARLWGLPLREAAPQAPAGPLDVMRPSSSARIRRAGCHGRRGLESREVQVHRGVRVTGLADTWCDLGEVLDLDDLVVVGDAVTKRLQGPGDLHAALSRRVRPRGAVVLRRALSLVRLGSDSPMETRCRLLFHRSGLPEPELNGVISHGHGGGFLCRSDFVWRAKRVIAEYQGADHFGSFDRGDDDISRRLLAEDDGWKYVELTKRDYFHGGRRAQLLARLAAYLLD